MPSTQLTALIVGGSSGIGLSAAKQFLKKGVRVCIADVNTKTGHPAAQELSKLAGFEVPFVAMDVTSSESIESGIKQAAESLGVIHMAVNTAGITGPMQPIHELDDEAYSKIMRIDLDGTFKFMRAILRYFRAQEPRMVRHDVGEAWGPVYQRGSLVNLASSIASVCQPLLGAYCAAKAGVILMSRSAALENADQGIRVNIISPGLTYTPLLKNDPGFDIEFATKNYLRDQPVGRFGHPDEIASGIVFTAMDTGSFMTGTEWGPNGGYHIA